MTRAALRGVAIAIAVAAAVDPSIATDAAIRPRVAIVVQEAHAPDAVRVREGLVHDLGTDYDVIPHIVSDAAAAIVIGDRYPSEPVAGGLRVMTVTIPRPTDRVRIARVAAPHDVPPATLIRVDVELEAHDAAGRSTELRARIGGVHARVVSHRWIAADERWRASLDVVPVGEPPFVVRIEATTATTGAGATASSVADVVVRRRTMPFGVEFVDARPSWASTFVRRALEADPRFRVESLNGESRGITTRTPGAVPLRDPQLDRFEAVVLGGLDRLTANDVAGVERYLRERGGAVVLLPDVRIDAGPARALLPDFSERLLERPAALVSPSGGAVLRASELLVARTLHAGADVLMQMPADGGAVVVAMPRAGGRLLASGAMDAWRYRAADAAAFDRFWQSTIAGLALAAPPPIDVEVTPAVLRPRDAATVTVRVRGGEPAWVSGSFAGQPFRLVPDAGRGLYRGRVTAGERLQPTTVDVQAVDARGGRQSTVQPVPIVADAEARIAAVEAPLSLLSASHRGLDVPPGRAPEIVQALRQSVRPTRATARRHPMRSAWWLVPFVSCLSAEWWLRRRRGLR